MTDFTTYFPFTGGPKAAEADWGLFAQLWATDGVVRGADSELLVQAHAPNNLSVDVLAGEVWIQGYFGRIGITTNFVISPHATQPRKDIVVARVNFATHKIELLYRTGVEDGTQTPPTLTRTPGVTWDIALAQISVAAGAGSILAGNITDRRPVSTGGSVVRSITAPSAATLLIPNCDQVPQGFMVIIPVSGTTGFNTIQAPTSGNPILFLEFSGALTVTTDTGNLRLARNLTTKAGTILVVEWDGTVWREITRSGETVTANLIGAGPASGAAATPTYRAMVRADIPATEQVPVGSIIAMARISSTPPGYLFCNGQLVSRTTYADLFAYLGTTFGAGDGVTTFKVPNYVDQFLVGAGSGYAADGTFYGASAVALGTANLASHTHTQQGAFTSGQELSDHVHGAGTLGFTGTPMGGHTHTLQTYTFNAGGDLVPADHGLVASLSTAPSTSSVSAGTPAGTIGGSTAGRNATHTHSTPINGETAATGSGSPFSIIPPSSGVGYFIKY